MTRPLAVLRPQPGNAATAARVEATGLVAIRLPLFLVTPVTWNVPDPAQYEALLITSANAVRYGGAQLERLLSLPVFAVGEATARAARDAGFHVEHVGSDDARAVRSSAGASRLLHLAGRDRIDAAVDTVTLYASDPIAVNVERLIDSVALVHSARAAARLAELAPDRARIAVAAISASAAGAAGDGWRAVSIADTPTDAALIAAARVLAD